MRWRRLERSSQVEDRRLPPFVFGGSLGVIAFVFAIVAFVIPGGTDPNPLDALTSSQGIDGTLRPE